MSEKKSWYLLYTKSGYRSLIPRIRSLGVSVFQPVLERVYCRKDCKSVRVSEVPLFPSYLFCYFSIQEVHTSRITELSGAVKFLSNGTICTVSPEIIKALECRQPHLYKTGETIDCFHLNSDLLHSVTEIMLIPDKNIRERLLSDLIFSINHKEPP